MRAIERAVYKLRNMHHRAPEASEYELTHSEVQALLYAGELLVSLVCAVEVGADIKIGEDA